jgi:hypothetical protein
LRKLKLRKYKYIHKVTKSYNKEEVEYGPIFFPVYESQYSFSEGLGSTGALNSGLCAFQGNICDLRHTPHAVIKVDT